MKHNEARLNVALLCFPYYPSKDTGRGHDRYAYELIENLRQNAPNIAPQVIEQGFSKGVSAAFGKLSKLARDLRSARADVYHAITPMGGAAAILAGKRNVVVTIHDLIPFHHSSFDYSWKYSYVRYCTRLCAQRAAAVIVPYRVTRDEVIQSLKGRPSRVHVVNYGVDHSTYHPRPELTRKARRVLYIGEVSRSKGVDQLIRAFHQVKASVPDAELVIGGKTNRDQPALEELARSLGVKDISFKGFIPEEELATYYATTSVMVFPSRYGFGLSVLEAMACGTPVVAAAALDAPEFVADAGLLVDPDDAGALAESIRRVLTEPDLHAELGRKGIQRAARFSWANMAAGTREIYESVARSG
ncbi:MAG: glycosyltransferase family 4 protein [Myxococcota bacterium]